ncbi:hypothetical protein, partial [Escherichia coli]|uniref:hypothetical protein n=1 Tax=Escherichia coli TaxID=562 RepID=UPI001AD914AF
MGYRVWLPDYQKIVRNSRDVVFNEAKLLKNTTSSDHVKKHVKFQSDNQATKSFMQEDTQPTDAEIPHQPMVQ